MAGQRLYDRGIRLVVIPPLGVGAAPIPLVFNTRPPITGLPAEPQVQIEVTINKSLAPQPNAATIRLYNLTQTTRDLLSGTVRRIVDWLPTAPVVLIDGILAPGGNEVTSSVGGMTGLILQAGYSGQLATVFTGTATRIRTFQRGPDRITEIAATDGGFQATVAVANNSFVPGTTAGVVVQYLAQVLGLRVAPTAGFALLSPFVLPGGLVSHGDPLQGIADLAEPLELDWWIEDGQLWLLSPGEILPGQALVMTTQDIPGAIRLKSEPEAIDDGGVRVRSVFAGEVLVGHAAALVTLQQPGTYRVEHVQHILNNRLGAMETTTVARRPTLPV